MSDDLLTKSTGNLLVAMHEHVRRLVGMDLVEPEKLQLTIEARRERAKELVDGGMSQRQAAAALGVSPATVNSDLAFKDRTGSVQKPNDVREEKRDAIVRKNDKLAAATVEPPSRPMAGPTLLTRNSTSGFALLGRSARPWPPQPTPPLLDHPFFPRPPKAHSCERHVRR